MTNHQLPSILVALALGAAPVQASAAPQTGKPVPATPTLEEQAVAAFEAGEFDRAIVLFEQAYATNPNPNLLYNTGRVHEEAGHLQQALEYYQRFVEASGVDLQARAHASERIAVIQKILDRTDGEPDSTAATDDPPQQTETEDDAPPPKRGPSPLGIAGYATLGLSGAVFIAAGITGGLAIRNNAALSGDDDLEDPGDVQRSGRRLAWATDGLLIAGGVTAAVGLTFVIVDAVRRRRNSSPEVARLGGGLSVSNRHGVLSVAGRF